MVDGIAASEKFRLSPYDGKLRGAGRESNWEECPDLKINSYQNLLLLKRAHDDGHLLLAKEIDVFAIGPNRETHYSLSITAASGTSKKSETTEPLADAIDLHLGIWNNDPRCFDQRGPLTSVQSDGAAVMRRALHISLTKYSIDPASKVGEALGKCSLKLFNYLCGGSASRPTVAGCDDNHVGKRLRMTVKALRGGTQVGDYTFTRELLRALLLEIGCTEAEVAEAFAEGSEDAQNVSAMVKFLRLMSKFTEKTKAGFCAPRRGTPMFRMQLKALHVLALYCRNFVEVITGLDALKNERIPLSELMRRASRVAHYAFVLFRRHATKFIPGQHYGNTQAMIKAKFISVASCQALNIPYYFSYFDSDQRLEELFGIQRCMECGSSMDMIQFEERGGSIMGCAKIYSDRPELNKTSSRLGGHLSDHQNPPSILGSPKNYKIVDVRCVTLTSSWALGASDVAADFTSSTHVEDDPPIFKKDEVAFETIAGNVGVDMMRPHGQWIGVDGSSDDPAEEKLSSSGGSETTADQDAAAQAGQVWRV